MDHCVDIFQKQIVLEAHKKWNCMEMKILDQAVTVFAKDSYGQQRLNL